MIYNDAFLIISVKPEYAKKILNGEKTIELRKCAPKKVGKDGYLLVYVTSPVKELWGIYKIKSIIKEKPNTLWEKFGDKTGVSKQEFYKYYKEEDSAFGIQIIEVKNLYKHSIKLANLKSIIPGFMPPQTYSYINRNIINYSSLKELLS